MPTATDSKSAATGMVPFADPFAGFTGHSFFYFCRLVDRVAGSMKHDSAPAEAAAESLLSSHTTSPISHWGACSLGTICCTVAAAFLIPLFNASTVKSIIPIPFLLIIVLVAFRFGRGAGVLGTMAAAFLFAWFLYEPAGLAVGDPVAKSHLIWMLIIGIVISDLLTRFKMSRMGGHKV
jgi:K+-sensing histidine kinase KdpD